MTQTICKCSVCKKSFVFDVKTCFMTMKDNYCAECTKKIKEKAKNGVVK